ncbi:heavy metal translocating P-type ATPase [Paracoccus sp. MBLB3053]|uniref:P-type Zn(2+) transporter n=1 Tax=Paracoccus aurantius TaxID=3073814 RepID=A0ABU2HV80_9RHOB|nr:heavy metal translocating P-type ATPase [Paracoccus sp. MBLB3053]MDS9468955.1 heavy metal translocating P-type ATPase [Paracoccus sp. MBLB3053]
MTEGTRRDWTVTGMDCAACATKVSRAIERLPGVSDVKVALMSERLTLNLAPGTTETGTIEDVVRKLGYGIAANGHDPTNGVSALPETEVSVRADVTDRTHQHHGHTHDDPADRGKPWYQTGKARLVLLTGGLLSVAWMFELMTSPEAGHWAFLFACLIGVAPVAKRAFEAARMGQPFTIESLMTIAALGALFIGAAEEAALVIFLFAMGEMLEGVAASKARDGIRALAALVPKTALLESSAGPRQVPVESLRIGQVVLVRPGDRVPADGVIVDGVSGVDESPVTGESVPRTKKAGDEVFAGSINAEAALRVRVTSEAGDNTISRIIRLVEEAETARAPTERFIERFSRWYMPLVVTIAALVAVLPPVVAGAEWGTWIYRGLALLLIGCPCALVISVPASIASALSSGARRGLLMKGGAVIEATAKVSHVAFDKTGTLTRGKPAVTDILPAPGTSEGDLLAIAGGVEIGSSHPLAQAILTRLAGAGLSPQPSTDSLALPGKGARARVQGVPTWVGSPRFAAEMGGLDRIALERATGLESEGKTVVAVFRANEPLGLIAMRDEPREDAADAMRQLKALGIGTTMLSGDSSRTAAAIAEGLGLDYRAEMMPEDKLIAIRDMGVRGGVMMIGDGINDAPALKQASIGVAMGSGTDVALETADAAILRDRVADVPALIRLSRATMANIRQNVALALGLKAVFLVTSVLGITGLWIAILADTGATVLVTLNALRLLGHDPSQQRRRD